MMMNCRFFAASIRGSERVFRRGTLKNKQVPIFIHDRLFARTPEALEATSSFSTDAKAPVAMDMLKQIKQDLVQADVNQDGRVCSRELKLILSKYPNVFSDQDVENIGELFHVGGGDVSHVTFVRGMVQAVQGNDKASNPLQIEKMQEEFDTLVLKYMQEIAGTNDDDASSEENEDPINGNTQAPLDMEVLRKIQKDVKASDVNKDGRLDFQELKIIFKRYTDVFSDEDVHAIGELFYKGNNGESVTHTTFLRGVVHASTPNQETSPLSLSNPTDNLHSFDADDNIQSKFDEYLLQYIEKVLERNQS